MAEGGLRAKAGQEIRLLDIHALRKYGCWDTLHGFESGAALSDALKRASVKHYGRAGRAFLERLTYDKRDFSAMLDRSKAFPAFASVGAEGQEKRAAGRFALIALAGELATEYGITGWPEGAAIEAAAIAFETWKSQRGRGNDERRQILEQLSSFIEQHGDSRFSNHKSDGADKTRDRAGWWRQEDDGTRTYLFNSAGINEALTGYDLKRALDILEESEVIPPANSKGERAKTIKIPGHGGARLYEVGYEKLQTVIRSNAGYVAMDTAVTTEAQSQ
jgi:putative DNA primase/helicase